MVYSLILHFPVLSYVYMLDISKIKAISLDLDDTLWPIWPVIERAEKVLLDWLCQHAPMMAAMFASPAALREIREYMADVMLKQQPEMRHDLSAIRRESIRLALYRAKEDPLLAEPAYDVFFAERNRVVLYDDALPALKALSGRFPLVALSNGNAQLDVIGLHGYFKASLSAKEFGLSKPDARIFVAAAGAVAVQPHEVLHIGDDAALDVLGALDAGMQAVWLNREEKLWPYEDKSPTLEVASLAEVCAMLL
jgi:FMN hydrolase / 5-amino-6-(5-phospho-D-ribitylamino)uracil phosphatase